jgi:hypothetical protein
MNRSRLYRGILVCALAGTPLFAGSAARAGDAVANPKYEAWAKFKPGSSETVSADMEVQASKIHIQMTRTLISIDDNNAVVETKSTVNLMGQDHESPARQETIPAKSDTDQLKQTGEKDIEAMNKTFKCKVYDTKGDPNAKPTRGAPDPESMKATVYASDEVPGGLVRLEAAQKDGKELTFILTAMESK